MVRQRILHRFKGKNPPKSCSQKANYRQIDQIPPSFRVIFEKFLTTFPQKSKTPTPKKFKVLILGKLVCMLFGLPKRQFHRRYSGFHCPVEVAVCLLQNTVQKPEALPALWLLGHDRWWGTVGLSGTCPALPPPRYLQGRSGYRKTRLGLRVRNTIWTANAECECLLLCEVCSE